MQGLLSSCISSIGRLLKQQYCLRKTWSGYIAQGIWERALDLKWLPARYVGHSFRRYSGIRTLINAGSAITKAFLIYGNKDVCRTKLSAHSKPSQIIMRNLPKIWHPNQPSCKLWCQSIRGDEPNNELDYNSRSYLSSKAQLVPTAKKLILGTAEAIRPVSERNQNRPGWFLWNCGTVSQ